MWHLDEIFNDLTVVAIPTRTNFRGVTIREAALFRGAAGWSEFSPFVEYSDVEAEQWLYAALEGANIPWPELKRSSIGINATLPKVEIDRVPEILKRFPGAKTVKIKVDDFENDCELVEAALDFNPDFKIRLDVNGGWGLETALLNLYNYYLRFGKVFEYIEQPCLEIADLKELKASETEVIDRVIEQMSDWSAAAISQYSHKDMPWIASKEGEIINYELAFYREAPFSVRNYGEEHEEQ